MKVTIDIRQQLVDVRMNAEQFEGLFDIIYYTSLSQRESIGIPASSEQALQDLRAAFKEVYFD